jgi:DNA-binding NtrC family response regulator
MVGWPKVLLLSSDDSESQKLEELFQGHAVLRRVRTLDELQADLQNGQYEALFCGWSFHSGSWHQALKQAQQRSPDMPVVVFSGVADERDWVRVLEAGAFDLLVTPYQKRTVLPVLEQAVTSCEARRYHHANSYIKAQAS